MRLLLTVLFFVPLLSLQAQTTNNNPETTREVFVFAFKPGDDIFYDNIANNEKELQRLGELIERYRAEIERKEITLFLEGYCASGPNQEENLRMAIARSRCVKSILVKTRGVIDDYFKTTNHATAYEGKNDMEVIIVNIPGKAVEPVQIMVTDVPEIAIPPVEEATPPQIIEELEVVVVEQPQQPVTEPEPAVISPVEMEELVEAIDATADDAVEREKIIKSYFGTSAKKTETYEGIWSLRMNLLYRLANMVNAGVEWKPSADWGLLLNAGWSGTEWSGGDRKLRLWMVSPEVRWYLSKDNRWYVGAEAHMGKFNIKLSDTGYQGNYMGGGLTAGYRTRLSRYFDMDFSLGLGYIYTDYDEYYRENGESVKINETRIKKNIIGPTQAGVSLIWKLK